VFEKRRFAGVQRKGYFQIVADVVQVAERSTQALNQ
jgi:hypothetical protein